MPADGDIIKRLGELADISTKTLTQLEKQRAESIEVGKKIDERLTALEKRGERTAKRGQVLDELRSDGAGGDADIEERIERAVAAVNVDSVEHNGARIPLIRSMPRGLAGVRDARGLVATRMIRMLALAQAHGRGTLDEAVERAAKHLGKDDAATQSLEEQRDIIKRASEDPDFKQRALGTSVLGSGAGFVAPSFATTFIDYLFAQSVMRRLGAMSMPLVGNGDVVTFLDSAITVAYRQENTAQNESSPQDGTLQVMRRILSGTVALSNELLEEASFAVDAILRTHLARAMASFADRKMILGRGVSNEIRGLDWWVEQPTTAHYFNRTLDSGAATVQTVMADFATSLSKITAENKGITRDEGAQPGVIMSYRDALGLMIAKEGTDPSRPFYDEIRGGSVFGMPLGKSTQLPLTDAGDGSGTSTNNKSKVFVADFASLAIYERDGLSIEAFRGGAYKDSTGTMQSGVSNRETVITADMHHDFVDLYRGKSIASIRSVDWGPAFGVS